MNLAVITWAGSVAENQRDAKTESCVILYRDWEMGRNQEKIKKKKKRLIKSLWQELEGHWPNQTHPLNSR